MAVAAKKKPPASPAAPSRKQQSIAAQQDPNEKKPEKKRKQVILTAAHRELQHRPNLTGWTPNRVETALSTADAGSMMQLADLVETIMRDDRVMGVLSTRTHGLLGLPVDFLGGSEEARQCLIGGDGQPGEWFSMHDESELAKLDAWGLLFGVGLAQRIPLPRLYGQPRKWRIETWSPRWLTYYHTPGDEGTHWRVLTTEGQEPAMPGDGEWIIYTPYGARRPWASGLWTAISFPWLLKRFSLEDRANLSEVLGSPVWVGTTKHTSTEKQRKDYLSRLSNLGKQGKIILPEGWDFQLREASGTAWENFDKAVEWADQAITIAIAGQIVTTEGTSGFSSGNIFEAIESNRVRFDAERLSTALRQQSLEPWARANYGSPQDAPWPRWNVQRPVDMEKRGTTIANLGKAITDLDAAVRPHGLTIDAEKLLAEYDIPFERMAVDGA